MKANRAQFLWLLVFTLYSQYLLPTYVLTHTFEILCTVELFGKFFFGSRQKKMLGTESWEQGQFFREQHGSSKLLPKPAPKIPLFLLITRLGCYVRFCIHVINYSKLCVVFTDYKRKMIKHIMHYKCNIVCSFVLEIICIISGHSVLRFPSVEGFKLEFDVLV